MPAIGLGTICRALAVGRVVKTSDAEKLPVGSLVTHFTGICEYAVDDLKNCNPVVPDVPLSWNLSVLYLAMGFTAWIGNKICAIKPGETYVVSGAAGAVGSIAG